MGIIDYIRGNRRGRDANRLEMEAMDDPFLTDAIEGYEAVYGDHPDIVERLEVWVQDRASRRRLDRRRSLWSLGIAASVVVAAGFTAVYMFTQYSPVRGTNMAQLIAEDIEVVELSPWDLGIPASGAKKSDVVLAAMGAGSKAAYTDKAIMKATVPDVVVTEKIDRNEISLTSSAGTALAPDKSNGIAQYMKPEVKVPDSLTPASTRQSRPGQTGDEVLIAARSVSRKEVFADPSGLNDNQPVVTRSMAADIPRRDTVSYAKFDEYFAVNRSRLTDTAGQPLRGVVEVEFRVNEKGVPSAIQVVSSFSRDANRELIDMLVKGPRWTPTGDRRIRIIVEYD